MMGQIVHQSFLLSIGSDLFQELEMINELSAKKARQVPFVNAKILFQIILVSDYIDMFVKE